MSKRLRAGTLLSWSRAAFSLTQFVRKLCRTPGSSGRSASRLMCWLNTDGVFTEEARCGNSADVETKIIHRVWAHLAREFRLAGKGVDPACLVRTGATAHAEFEPKSRWLSTTATSILCAMNSWMPLTDPPFKMELTLMWRSNLLT